MSHPAILAYVKNVSVGGTVRGGWLAERLAWMYERASMDPMERPACGHTLAAAEVVFPIFFLLIGNRLGVSQAIARRIGLGAVTAPHP